MFAVRLPDDVEMDIMIKRLYAEFHIEAPAIRWNGQNFLRISIQGYNTTEDVDRLINALNRLLITRG